MASERLDNSSIRLMELDGLVAHVKGTLHARYCRAVQWMACAEGVESRKQNSLKILRIAHSQSR